MVTGFPAFVGGSDYLIFKQIVDLEEGQLFLPLPSDVFPPGLEDWVRFVMVRDHALRPTLEQAMQHPFFSQKSTLYGECVMTADDLLVQECHKRVTQEMKMNPEILATCIEEYLAKVDQPQIVDKKRTSARLRLLSKQLRHYFKMEEYQYVQESL